jgi:hypothetical protein
LPWDVWGAQPPADAQLDEKQLAYFDRLAILTTHPDQTLGELRQAYRADDGLRVPDRVFNALLQKPEALE